MRILNRLLCGLGAVVGLAFQPAQATLPGGGGGDTTKPISTYYEQGILIRSGETVQPLGPNLMGDAVNEYSGGLSFTHTDVSLPGNFALPVAVGRHRAVGTTQTYGGGLFGDWDLDIPRLHTVATVKEPNWYGANSKTNLARCSQFREPPGTYVSMLATSLFFSSNAFWDGYHLYVPGSGDQTLLRRTSFSGEVLNPIGPTDGGSYPVVTKNHWQLSCLPTLDTGTGGEAFMALSPDGTRYRFDHLVVRPWARAKVSGMNGSASGIGFIERVEVSLLPTLVTDRFGNWVRYTYVGSADGWRVAGITSSDGRSITFTYTGNGNRIATASDGTRTWTYAYDAGGTLQTVTLPDGSRWQFALGATGNALPFHAPEPGCDRDGWNGALDETAGTGTITHPSGAVGTFVIKSTAHGRSNVPGSTSCGPSANPISRYFAVRSLASKTLSGPGMPAQTWTYTYSLAVGSYAPCNGCVNTKTVTIVDPLGHTTVNTYGTMVRLNEGLLLKGEEGVVGGTALKTATYGYALPNAGPWPAVAGAFNAPADTMSPLTTPQVLRTITQQGVTFTQQVSTLDTYARPVSLSRSSSIGPARNEVTTYYDDTRLWVLGQVTGVAVNGVAASYTSYYPNTALPMARYSFGKLLFGLGYQADGNVARLTDGLGRVTYFGSYARGLPQSIVFPDGRSIGAVVNNIGTIDSVTNEVGTTWRFGYDAMGRLASKTPPVDSVAWHPTSLKFEQVNAPEVGLEAGHWRQTITTGNAVTVNYFDARWRKRLTTTYDAANAAATRRTQRFDFDPYNRTTFAAYPARSIADIASSVPGTRTSYDALGRVVSSVADSEVGPLSSSTQYLSGYQRLSINPRGLGTVTTFQVFDEPSENSIASITAPEGLKVTINRDAFSKPLSITRSGTWNSAPLSATRSYVYDANHRLCKTVEPETGATIEAVDAADNVAWRATGLALTSTTSCDQASVPAANKVSYTYDTRKRLLSTTFGDGSPAITRTYTADGLPLSVASGSATWTYGYNQRRLLTNEWLAYGGSTLNIGRLYDPHGHVRQLIYPGGASVTYAPNALGEPTQVGSYATGVTHHPNGAVAGYTLGNGIAHTLTQNLRGLPLLNRDAGVLQDQYAYDANGNVLGITDLQEGVTTRTMAYDGLDRLTAATAPGVWGTGLYGYDVLGNLRTSRVGSRNATHAYGANNLLANINVNGAFTGYAYDARGNVTGRGTQGFFFDLGNRMTLTNGVASYSYDGHGRRVGVSGNNGLVKTNVYDQSGQLLFSSAKQGTSLWTTRFVYLGGKLIAETDANGVTTYEHTDGLGSTVARTNAAGQLLSRTRYEPYGGFAAGNYSPGSTGLTDIGFTGHVNDPDTGLVYMQQRYYDPMAARFMSVDPVTTDASTGKSFNRYEYVASNPFKFTDPDGRECLPACQIPTKPLPEWFDGRPLDWGHGIGANTAGDDRGPQGSSIPSPGAAQAQANQELADALNRALDHVGETLSYIFRSDSVKLARNMAQSGMQRQTGDAAHHIAAATDQRAARARAVLASVGMDINDAHNGVFLPSKQHAPIHTNLYHLTVTENLRGSTTYSEVAARLGIMRAAIQLGVFPK